jgi:hypothetical protein
VGDRAQGPARNPGAATFIAGNRPPASGANPFTTRVDATTDRTRSGNNYQARFAFGSSIKRNISITDDGDLSDSHTCQRLSNSRAQFVFTSASQSNVRGYQVRASYTRHFACLIDCFANRCGSVGNTNSQWVRWACHTFTENIEVGIHYDCVSLGATPVNPNNCSTSFRSACPQEICSSALSRDHISGECCSARMDHLLPILGNAHL